MREVGGVTNFSAHCGAQNRIKQDYHLHEQLGKTEMKDPNSEEGDTEED